MEAETQYGMTVMITVIATAKDGIDCSYGCAPKLLNILYQPAPSLVLPATTVPHFDRISPHTLPHAFPTPSPVGCAPQLPHNLCQLAVGAGGVNDDREVLS